MNECFSESNHDELVIIDSNITDVSTILSSLAENQYALLLSDGTGVDELLSFLTRSGNTWSAMHFITHGSDASFSLNGETISSSNLDLSKWAELGSYLAEGGDILLYGCNIASTDVGKNFIARLADATGADVAASDDITGLGGDWNLESSTGAIEAENIASSAYDSTLYSGRLVINEGESKKISNDTFSGNSATGSGGAVYNNEGTFTATGNTFSGNAADEGGAVYNNRGTFTATGNTFSGNTANSSGGAVYNNEGTFTATSNTFSGNSASISGAAVYNYSGTFTATGNTFSGNYGGAVCNSLGTFTATSNTFSGNSGGAVYNNEGTFTATGNTFSGNSSSSGGAVDNSGTFIATSNTFSGNSVSKKWGVGGGGAVYNEGTFTATGNTFSGNIASETHGGAVWNYFRGVFNVTDCIFSDNSAQTGGAVYNTGTINMKGSVTLETDSDTIYNAGILNWDLTTGIDGSYGYVNRYDLITNAENASMCITVSDSNRTIGAKYVLAGVASTAAGQTFLIKTEYSGTAEITPNGENIVVGRYVYSLNVDSQTKELSLSVIAKTTQEDISTSLQIAEGETKDINTPEYQGKYWTCATGTAISNSGTLYGQFKANEGLVFYANASTEGGAIYNKGKSEFSNVTFSWNQASTNGGAMYNSGTFTATGNTFSKNGAFYGGAVYNKGTFTANTNTFTRNMAGTYGGAVYNNEGTFTATGNTFSGNSATESGGAVYNNEGTFTATSNTFSGNIAFGLFGEGGAVSNIGEGHYNEGEVFIVNEGTFTATGNTFSGNSADCGGAVYNYYGTFTATSNTFSGNTATDFGGAVYNSLGTFTATGNTFSGNSASTGGAVSNHDTFTATGNTFSGNSASSGGAVYINGRWGNAIFTATDNTFSGNSASAGGAVYNFFGTCTAIGNTFSGNMATNGGAVDNSYNLNSVFSDNQHYFF